MNGEMAVMPTADALAQEGARRFAEIATAAIAARGEFLVALSGGSTPKSMYALLAADPYRETIDWQRVIVLWGDERCVPPDDANSNYKMARQVLLNHVPLQAVNVRRIRGEYSPAGAATAYEEVLRATLAGKQLDLLLLGLGEDGHTASLFPGDVAVHDSEQWVSPAISPAAPANRVTLTPAILNTAANVHFLVAGAAKSAILRRVIAGPRTPHQLPAQLIAPAAGRVSWLIDRAASAGLQGAVPL